IHPRRAAQVEAGLGADCGPNKIIAARSNFSTSFAMQLGCLQHEADEWTARPTESAQHGPPVTGSPHCASRPGSLIARLKPEPSSAGWMRTTIPTSTGSSGRNPAQIVADALAVLAGRV